MSKWRRIALSSDIREHEPLVVDLTEDESVVITRIDGELSAFSNSCPHYGGPLGDGVLKNGKVTCPFHNASFSARDGSLRSAPAIDDLAVYLVREQDGAVFLGDPQIPEISMPDGDDDRKVVIAGAGAAGSACAETLRKEGFAGSITLLTDEDYSPYDRPMLSKAVISGNAPGSASALRDETFYTRLHIQIRTGERITGLDPANKVIHTSDGEYQADMILLATGAKPVISAVPGSDSEGVFTLRSRGDAEAIVGAATGANSAVVVGAGFIGMETAAELAKRELEVTVVDQISEPMERILGKRTGSYLRKLHESKGVRFNLNSGVRSIENSSGSTTVTLDTGQELRGDLVVVGVGVRPNLDYLTGTELLGDGDEVVVNEYLETGSKDIYAAGDVALYPVDGTMRRVEHWVHAMQQGRHVARRMLGKGGSFRDLPFFWTRQYKTTVKFAGYPDNWDSFEYRGDPESGEFLTGHFTDGYLAAISGKGLQCEFAKTADKLEKGAKMTVEAFASI